MRKMKIDYRALAVALSVPLIVGAVSGLISRGGMAIFAEVAKPPLSPPGWLFPVVWTLLYILMGIASYLVYVSGEDALEKKSALGVYAVQLAFNFLWSIWFFNLRLYAFSFVWLLALLALIAATAVRFYRIAHVAGYLLIPYILWVCFAGYLNFGIAVLN